MIYRMASKFGEAFFSAVLPVPPDGLTIRRDAGEYDFCFEELPLDSSWGDCRIFRAPIQPEWRINCTLEIEVRRKGGVIPDFIAWQGGIYVTDLVKDIIEQEDPFCHQFWPVSASILKNGKKSTAEKPYFRMNVRRYVSIEPSDLPMLPVDFKPSDSRFESKIIANIQHNTSLREKLEMLPLWQYFGPISLGIPLIYDSVLFLNKALIGKFNEAGVSGIREYSVWNGKDQETVGHV